VQYKVLCRHSKVNPDFFLGAQVPAFRLPRTSHVRSDTTRCRCCQAQTTKTAVSPGPSPNHHTLALGIMAVGLTNRRHGADEEARAEVDVLNSRLEKTTQLTKKIQACLGRLEATGKSVRDVSGPLNGETKKLQILGNSEYYH
jgi:hypothetical protein